MRFSRSIAASACAVLLGTQSVLAIELDLSSDESIKKAAKIAASDMLTYYTGDKPGDVPGNLPDPYYWWLAGAMFGALIDYWYYTGDDTWNAITQQGMLHQVGPDKDFMPPNQTKTLGNDDQAFWGMAAMSAAEVGFPNPPDDQPQWLALAQAVFNSQVPRWNTDSCGGGFKWQIFTFNNGYNYKNTISNGCFFNIAARLAKYTGNTTYSDWAERTWAWTEAIGLMTPDYHFFDGTDDTINCTELNRIQWTYNAGVYLYGAAAMWNFTESDIWRQRVQGILDGTEIFFSTEVPNVMYEVACEPNGKCDVDQRSFKAYLSRWMAATSKVAPWTADYIMPKLQASAQAAAAQCVGGENGQLCGLKWTTGGVWDGDRGVGEQMSVLEVIQSNLVRSVSGALTAKTGGISKGDPTAGSNSRGRDSPAQVDVITTGDKVGAGFLTTLVLASILGGSWWMVA